MEGAELGVFMVSACAFTVLLEHPLSPAHAANPLLRHSLEALAMGLTLLALIFSPWGKRSGAHMNPGFTLSFYLLGKVRRWDAAFYAIAQFVGAILGVGVSAIVLGDLVRHPAVNYAITVPGPGGPSLAFAAEFLISSRCLPYWPFPITNICPRPRHSSPLPCWRAISRSKHRFRA